MQYDLIVIGTGPGGYVCAVRAAQLGVTLVYHGVSSKLATYEQILLDLGLSDAQRARIEAEVERQVELIEGGGKVVQETVAQLGELDAEGRAKARALARTITGRDEQRELFEDAAHEGDDHARVGYTNARYAALMHDTLRRALGPLAGRRVLVVGGGLIARRKAEMPDQWY